MDNDETRYSPEFPGEHGNYRWTVRFDMTDSGYVGVTQKDGLDIKDRVLLSPKQVKELTSFIERKGRSR